MTTFAGIEPLTRSVNVTEPVSGQSLGQELKGSIISSDSSGFKLALSQGFTWACNPVCGGLGTQIGCLGLPGERGFCCCWKSTRLLGSQGMNC